ncbi:hypothetical protein ACM39_05655 [Chryseobacterium sp. FH2]|uniref:hypothetical protein n=1 Tax=Chryseobacterium sp. FH2 TaxID=1674291 RepID=UPI00065A9354|nr:hypothetical protein [Chryseobacterium sp. FH2]KMQ68774.1 hypothetical protein ACM39_05655 [Chryseobacterium sp. FH2]
MKPLIYLPLIFLIFSCREKEEPKPAPKDFAEKVVDFTIANADTTEDRIIELTRLYNQLANSISDDGNESSSLQKY